MTSFGDINETLSRLESVIRSNDLSTFPGYEWFPYSKLVEIAEGRFIVQYWRNRDGGDTINVRLRDDCHSVADRAALVSLWRTIGRRHGMKCLSNKGQSAIRFIARTGGRGVLHLAERSEIRRAS